MLRNTELSVDCKENDRFQDIHHPNPKSSIYLLGRKNWLFAGAPNGADAGAAFFSLIEAAKANGLESYSYLRCLFEQLPFVKKTKMGIAACCHNISIRT